MENQIEILFILSLFPSDKNVKRNQLFHILSGKRTASNLYNAKTLQLLPVFGIKENINRKQYDALFNLWIKKGFLLEKNQEYAISLKTTDLIEKMKSNNTFPIALDMGRFGNAVQLFWNRLQLLVQVLSNKAYLSGRYAPIITARDIQLWAKGWMRMHSSNQYLPQSIGTELMDTLKNMNVEEAKLISSSLSGFQKVGSTSRQRAVFLKTDKETSQFKFIDTLHHFYKLCFDNKENIFLHNLAHESDQDSFEGVTQSTFKTVHLIKNGKSPFEISQLRNLKEGTVWEHLIEWSIIHPDFSFHSLIPGNIYSEVLKELDRSPLTSFSDFKERIPELTFAWFRLIQLERSGIDERGQDT